MSFWDSVAELRRAELIALIATMVLPVLGGTVLLTLRYRIRSLQTQMTEHQTAYFAETAKRFEHKRRSLKKELATAHSELGALREVTAPRQITRLQEDILVERLRTVKAAPVIVSAFTSEDECADYAEQIAGVLRKAGWDVTMNRNSMNDFKGISLSSINVMHQKLIGLHELAEAFNEAHLELHQRDIAPESIAGQLQDGSLLVVVGRK